MIKNITITILVIIFAAISLYNIFLHPALLPRDYLALSNMGIGALSVLFLLFRIDMGSYLFGLWAALQLVTIDLGTPIELSMSSELLLFHEINFIQGFGFQPDQLVIPLGELLIRPNVLPVVFILLLLLPDSRQRILRVSSHVSSYQEGQEYQLDLFRSNKTLGHLLPQKVKVVQSINLSGSQDWLLVNLSRPLKFRSGRVIYNALIKSKDGDRFRKKRTRQMAYFRLLKDRKALQNGELDLEHTMFVDWVFVK